MKRFFALLLYGLPLTLSAAFLPQTPNWLNVTNGPYFAIGDGVTDSTAAFSNAMSSAASLGRPLYVPDGTYIVNTLTFPNYGSNVVIIGNGPSLTILQAKNANSPIFKGGLLTAGKGVSRDNYVGHLAFKAHANGAIGNNGTNCFVDCRNISNSQFDDIWLLSNGASGTNQVGFYLYADDVTPVNCYYDTFQRIFIDGQGPGTKGPSVVFRISGTASSHTIKDCRVTGTAIGGVPYVTEFAEIAAYCRDISIERNKFEGMQLLTTSVIYCNSYGTFIRGNYFENTGRALNLVAETETGSQEWSVVEGNSFAANTIEDSTGFGSFGNATVGQNYAVGSLQAIIDKLQAAQIVTKFNSRPNVNWQAIMANKFDHTTNHLGILFGKSIPEYADTNGFWFGGGPNTYLTGTSNSVAVLMGSGVPFLSIRRSIGDLNSGGSVSLLTISNSVLGNVTIPGDLAVNSLSVTGITTGIAPFRGLNGSSVNPTYSFSAATNTGMYSAGASDISFAFGGSRLALLNGTPSFALLSDAGGILLGASTDISLKRAAASTWLVGSNAIVQGTVTVTNGVIEPNLRAALASDATTTSTTFANLGLTATLVAGKTYEFTAILFLSDSVSADGAKVDFNGGTATMTDFRAQFTSFDTALNLSTQSTALGTAASMSTFTGNGMVEVHGALTVNAAGTFIPRFAQAGHTTGTLTCFRGSNIIFRLF